VKTKPRDVCIAIANGDEWREVYESMPKTVTNFVELSAMVRGMLLLADGNMAFECGDCFGANLALWNKTNMSKINCRSEHVTCDS
jgi:hypothetical protein